MLLSGTFSLAGAGLGVIATSKLTSYRLGELEKKVDTLDKKVDALDGKIDEIKNLVAAKCSFWGSLKEVLSNKVFIYLLIIITASICGVQVADLGTFLFK